MCSYIWQRLSGWQTPPQIKCMKAPSSLMPCFSTKPWRSWQPVSRKTGKEPPEYRVRLPRQHRISFWSASGATFFETMHGHHLRVSTRRESTAKRHERQTRSTAARGRAGREGGLVHAQAAAAEVAKAAEKVLESSTARSARGHRLSQEGAGRVVTAETHGPERRMAALIGVPRSSRAAPGPRPACPSRWPRWPWPWRLAWRRPWLSELVEFCE